MLEIVVRGHEDCNAIAVLNARMTRPRPVMLCDLCCAALGACWDKTETDSKT